MKSLLPKVPLSLHLCSGLSLTHFSYLHFPYRLDLSAMWVSSVRLAADAYLVCLHHALTTEKEEVMGLLVGQFSEVLKAFSVGVMYIRLINPS